MQSKLTGSDTPVSMVVKLSEGNIGAISVLTRLLAIEDPRVPLALLDFDMGQERIYGPRIWLCYKDLLGEDIHVLYQHVVNHTLRPLIERRCQEDSIFAAEWRYAAK